jgi:hypothetical protein
VAEAVVGTIALQFSLWMRTTESKMTPGATFRLEFLEKKLLSFDECREHYEQMTPDQLVKETDFLFGEAVRAINFAMTHKRYYAYLVSLIWCAGNFQQMENQRRASFINMIITTGEYIRRRTNEGVGRDAFDAAIATTLENLTTYGLFPKVAELIANRQCDYSGPFETGIIGELLERRVPE